ncbi:MAG: hypothetical protein DDT32_02164 [Syntrophomonadaceae bacterium]|nr:hypothetical protein [Bacillota bacterium]
MTMKSIMREDPQQDELRLPIHNDNRLTTPCSGRRPAIAEGCVMPRITYAVRFIS